MAEFPALPLWTDIVKDALVEGGWKSPDTYSNAFGTIPAAPCVYMIVAYTPLVQAVVDPFVAYVGMSTILANRLDAKHEIWRQLNREGFWPQRWFHKVERKRLRAIERRLIRRLNPPYNIIGRKRGVS